MQNEGLQAEVDDKQRQIDLSMAKIDRLESDNAAMKADIESMAVMHAKVVDDRDQEIRRLMRELDTYRMNGRSMLI